MLLRTLCFVSCWSLEAQRKGMVIFMTRKQNPLRERRVVYQGKIYHALLKMVGDASELKYDFDVVCIKADRHMPGAYLRYGRWVRDISVSDTTAYYIYEYSVLYRGHKFRINAVYLNTQEVRLATGDNYGELHKAMEDIGIQGASDERGYRYFVHLPYMSLGPIEQMRYDYKTEQRSFQQITPQEFWRSLLEVYEM